MSEHWYTRYLRELHPFLTHHEAAKVTRQSEVAHEHSRRTHPVYLRRMEMHDLLYKPLVLARESDDMVATNAIIGAMNTISAHAEAAILSLRDECELRVKVLRAKRAFRTS